MFARILGILCLGLAAAILPVAASAAPYSAPETYDGVERSSQYISSGDGTRLAISVWRPTKAGQIAAEKLPVIAMQNRSETDQVRYFVKRGYVVVGQDRRGTGASFGRQTGFVNSRDVMDARAVIEWAGAQPFSNEKAVAMGCSNQGAWQYVTALTRPKYLVAIAPACASPQFFDDGISLNGVPGIQLPAEPYSGACAPSPPAAARGDAARPERDPAIVDTDADGALFKAAQAERCNAPFLGQYWANMPRDGLEKFDNYRPGIEDSAVSRAAALKSSGVAVLQLGAWWDAGVVGQFAGHSYFGGRVVMGPWVHGNTIPRGGDYPNGMIDLNAETLRWFDHYAKGVDNGADRSDVLYYTVNAPAGQEWRTAPRFRWNGDRMTKYYFGDDGLTTKRVNATPITYAGRDVGVFDGRYQVLSRWYGGDMSAADAQSLSKTGPAFTADTEVTGAPLARLWISADTQDVNIHAFLEDVGPDGKSTFVTDGRLRASWRKAEPSPWRVREHVWHRGLEADLAPLNPGEPAELLFNLTPTSYVFRKGHRPRISIVTSMSLPFQAPPLAKGAQPTIQLYRSGRHASSVALPIMVK